MKRVLLAISLVLLFASCGKKETAEPLLPGATVIKCSVNGNYSAVAVEFSTPLDLEKDCSSVIRFVPEVPFSLEAGPNEETVILNIEEPLGYFEKYTLVISKGEGLGVRIINPYKYAFTTPYDPSDKFPRVSTDSLLTLVQKRTFAYFWDYAHPVSGLARERLGSGETVTAGGSGFGLMAVIVGAERGFVSRGEACERVEKIVDFLGDKAVRYHGAFPHWMNGSSGATLPFSAKDDGADLVETSFLMEGLLACRQYFSEASESALRDKITALWEAVEWDWFLRNGRLMWHWSPNCGWEMNMSISGWNEALITYVLAAASPTHSISKTDYEGGWAQNGAIRNGKTFYDITLPLGADYGGPLFFAHYSFLGLDPRGLSDQYASYWEQNVAHSKINHAYCEKNPKNMPGYSAECWGLTASDTPGGYGASSPTKDIGVIAPTAALASMPYTPEQSIAALEHFYYVLGDRLFGEYGFYDAFSLRAGWFASSYIAIDQGPIAVMIENYRSGAVWNAFMSDPDVLAGLEKLGFSRE